MRDRIWNLPLRSDPRVDKLPAARDSRPGRSGHPPSPRNSLCSGNSGLQHTRHRGPGLLRYRPLDTSEESPGAEHRRRVGCKRGQTTSQVSLREPVRISLAEALAPTDPNAALYCLRHLAVGMFSRPHEAHGVLNGAPHSVQNFNASGVSVLRFSQSTCQFPFTHSVGRAALWRPSLRGVEAFGESVADFREHRCAPRCGDRCRAAVARLTVARSSHHFPDRLLATWMALRKQVSAWARAEG